MKRVKTWAFFLHGLPVLAFAEPTLQTVDQAHLNEMVKNGKGNEAFLYAFEAGDELTEFSFDAERGVGGNVGEGRRFTRFPRADLNGPTEWANHFPKREGGANATSCIACHNAPFANGAGDVALNVVVDPAHTGDPTKFLERNTLPLFALGIPQRLAEEISLILYAQREKARVRACNTGGATTQLNAKGVPYGELKITRVTAEPCEVEIDTSGLDGIDADLVIKPFGWKGNKPTIRSFTRDAAHNELGLQADELVGDADGDYDGVINELSVGDMTSLTIYMAGLERPVSMIELADLELVVLTDKERSDILEGAQLFEKVGCASCHVPAMPLEDTMFREPSLVPGFFDTTFPDGSVPASHGLVYDVGIAFDLAADQPNNRIDTKYDGTHHLGALETAPGGTSIAYWYTDFKRHDMGSNLSDPDDPLGLGASMFLTRSLAGVGMTGPWLHDGRATSLTEAIQSHGGEAGMSAAQFEALQREESEKIIAFLSNLVMYQAEEEH